MTIVVIAIILALAFDFMNGFHDCANSIATIVSTRVLTPKIAVIWAAFFNFVAFALFGVSVAATIGKGIVTPELIDPTLVIAALSGAIVWNIITWYYGIPSSSSHALIGALAGAGLVKGGLAALESSGLIKAVMAIVASPVIGFFTAGILLVIASHLSFRVPTQRASNLFKGLQLVSAAAYSLGHGGNDAQKTMGIICALLFSAGMLGETFHVPLWVVLICHSAMALGTLFGGWRIVKTMGLGLTELRPIGGCCAETAAAINLFGATALGVPVSTTHTITGAILGVGTTTKPSSVRWSVGTNILVAWILTIPASGAISALCWIFLRLAQG